MAVDADVAVTVGAKPLALVATEAVCANTAVDADAAVAAGLKVVALAATEAD